MACRRSSSRRQEVARSGTANVARNTHVEVFPVDSVGNSILEDLEPYPEINATTHSIAKIHLKAKNKVAAHHS